MCILLLILLQLFVLLLTYLYIQVGNSFWTRQRVNTQSKCPDFQEYKFYRIDPDVHFFSKWYQCQYDDKELEDGLEGYEMVWQNRVSRRGGGVAIFIALGFKGKVMSKI